MEEIILDGANQFRSYFCCMSDAGASFCTAELDMIYFACSLRGLLCLVQGFWMQK